MSNATCDVPFFINKLYVRVDEAGNLVGMNGVCSNDKALDQYGSPYGTVKILEGPFKTLNTAVDSEGKLLKIANIGPTIADNYPVLCNGNMVGYKFDGDKKIQFVCSEQLSKPIEPVKTTKTETDPIYFMIGFILLFVLVIVIGLLFPNSNRGPYGYNNRYGYNNYARPINAPVVVDARPQTDTVNVNLTTKTIGSLFGYKG
jgi:hypothetical protein